MAVITNNAVISDLKNSLIFPLNSPAKTKKFIAPKIIPTMRMNPKGNWVAGVVILSIGEKPPVLNAEKMNETRCTISEYPNRRPTTINAIV